MKKRFLAMLLTICMVLGLTACGSTAEKPAETDAPAPSASDEADGDNNASASDRGDVTLTFMACQDWVQDAELELAEKFTEQTGIKIDYQIVPFDQYESLLKTKLNTGECTDIFGHQSSRFDMVASLNVEKNAVDLSGESWASNVEEAAALELSVDGRIYGQPAQDVSAVWAVAYNKVLFDELNLEIPTDYQSFTEVCDAVLAAGVTPIYECVSDGWHHVLWFPELCIACEDGTVEALNNNEATFAGNETMTLILNQMLEMIERGYWGEYYMSNEYANAPQAIADGEYAMTVANQGFGLEVENVGGTLTNDDIGYFLMPLADNQTRNVNGGGPSRFIWSGSKHQEEAKQYLEFLATEESLAYLTEKTNKFYHLPFTNAPETYEGNVADFYKAYPESETVYQIAVKYVNPIWNEMGEDLSAMFVGEMTPEEFLQDIDKMRAEQATTAGDAAWK